MIYKYFVKFDASGDIDCFCKIKPQDCEEKCEEYVIKLLPVERNINDDAVKLVDSANELSNSLGHLSKVLKKGVLR